MGTAAGAQAPFGREQQAAAAGAAIRRARAPRARVLRLPARRLQLDRGAGRPFQRRRRLTPLPDAVRSWPGSGTARRWALAGMCTESRKASRTMLHNTSPRCIVCAACGLGRQRLCPRCAGPSAGERLRRQVERHLAVVGPAREEDEHALRQDVVEIGDGIRVHCPVVADRRSAVTRLPSVAATLEHEYRYGAESACALEDERADLRLFTSQPHPRFFEGWVTDPLPHVSAFLLVARTARTSFYERVNPSLLDPVVTCHVDRLRFEAFSSCCGVYVRYDMGLDALDGELMRPGATNIDVNPPLRAALGRLGPRRVAAPRGGAGRADGHDLRRRGRRAQGRPAGALGQGLRGGRRGAGRAGAAAGAARARSPSASCATCRGSTTTSTSFPARAGRAWRGRTGCAWAARSD